MYDHRVGTVQEFAGGGLEIGDLRIEHGHIQIRPQEFQHAIGFNDHIACILQALPQCRHRLCETTLFRTRPENSRRSRRKKSRGIGFTAPIALFGDRPRVVARRALTGLAVSRADSVTILRNLDGRPLEFPKRRDEPRHYAGLPYVP